MTVKDAETIKLVKSPTALLLPLPSDNVTKKNVFFLDYLQNDSISL